MIKHVLFILIASLFSKLYASTVEQKIYIIADSLSTVDGFKIPYITFNDSNSFAQSNPIINLSQGDSLSLWIVNHNANNHNFEIKGIGGTFVSIPTGDSAHVGITFNFSGNFIYHDPLDYPANTYLGLGGVIAVKDHSHKSFFWNVREHDDQWNTTLTSSGSVNWNNYYPNYFTINGNSNPHINSDTNARITGSVGDTLILYIANIGRSIHSMHFHGYHATILYASKNSNHIGRSKDTFPIYPMETLVLEIIPDKSGEYPVHDHNLVAITGNNIYPNGMFSSILISP